MKLSNKALIRYEMFRAGKTIQEIAEERLKPLSIPDLDQCGHRQGSFWERLPICRLSRPRERLSIKERMSSLLSVVRAALAP